MITWKEFDPINPVLDDRTYLVYEDFGGVDFKISAGTWIQELGCFLDRCDDDTFTNITHYAEINMPRRP